MRTYLILALVVIILLVLLGRWFTRTPSAQVTRGIRKLAIYGGAALLILLVVTGRLPWLFAVIGGLLPLGRRALMLWRGAQFLRRHSQGTRPSASGQSSTVETRFLRMSLDHDTGAMSGVVLAGNYCSRKLDELTVDELVQMLAEFRIANDGESVTLLETYLDRTHGDSWREQQAYTSTRSAYQPSANTTMTGEEAWQILGLEQGATKKEIKQAHRRLMQKFHPDRGGSDYLAIKINQAKQLLLGLPQK